MDGTTSDGFQPRSQGKDGHIRELEEDLRRVRIPGHPDNDQVNGRTISDDHRGLSIEWRD